MKVLALVTDAFGGRGGIALYNRNILSALCAHPRRPRVTAFARTAHDAVAGLPEGLDFSVVGMGRRAAFATSALGAALRGRGSDLVVCGHINLLPLAVAAGRVSGAPVMLFVYGLDAWARARPLSAACMRGVDTLVSIRQYTLDQMAQWAQVRGRSRVLENAIHLEAYGPGPKSPSLLARYGLEGKRVLMTLGRTDDRNFGFDEILEVLPELTERVPGLVYVVAGSGQDEARLREKASALPPPARVVFTGEVPEHEKADHYRLADAFAMPGTAKGRVGEADFDTYPLRFTFLEAMACGLPVVGTRPEDERERTQSPLPIIYVDPRQRDELIAGLSAALERGAGSVPEELRRYAFSSFCTRLHSMVDDMLPGRATQSAAQ